MLLRLESATDMSHRFALVLDAPWFKITRLMQSAGRRVGWAWVLNVLTPNRSMQVPPCDSSLELSMDSSCVSIWSLFLLLLKCSYLEVHGHSTKEGTPCLHSRGLVPPSLIQTVGKYLETTVFIVKVDGVDELGAGCTRVVLGLRDFCRYPWGLLMSLTLVDCVTGLGE